MHADFSGGVFELGEVARRQYYSRSRRGQGFGASAPDAAARAGYKCSLVKHRNYYVAQASRPARRRLLTPARDVGPAFSPALRDTSA